MNLSVMQPVENLWLRQCHESLRFRCTTPIGHGNSTVVLNLFHCWDPLNATDVVWDPQVKIEKVCAPE